MKFNPVREQVVQPDRTTFIKSEISNNSKVNIGKRTKNNKETLNCRIRINSEEICSDLIKYGFKINKTGNEVFPSIPKYLYYPYFTGLFDGDGCITLRKNCNSAALVLVSANELFLEDIKYKICSGYGHIYKHREPLITSSLEITKRDQIIELFTEMYYNSEI